MAVIIVYREVCNGCGECVEICPAAVFEIDEEGKAEPTDADACMECCSCVEVCPVEAIKINTCD